MGRWKKTKPYGDPNPQKISPNHQNNKETSWPNLPQRLIKHISKNPNTLRHVNFGLATKSWESNTTTRHNTKGMMMMIKYSSSSSSSSSSSDHYRLVVSDHDHADDESVPRPPHFCSVEFRLRRERWHYSWHTESRAYHDSYPFDRYAGCSSGFVFVRAASDSSRLFSFCPFDRCYNDVPDLPDNVPFRCAALSSLHDSYPDWSCALMVATGIGSPALVYCRLDNMSAEWTELDCSVNDPSDKRSSSDDRRSLMRFTNLIGFKGKFYALSCQGTLAVIEQVGDGGSDDRFEVTALGKTRAVPSVPFRGFKECLIESDGEILLVLLASVKAKTAFDLVEVYRFRFEDHSWIKMESLGERTLFVGNDSCVSVCAEKVGCRGNCVYFMQRGSDVWFEFDMEFGGISRAWTDRAILSSGNPLEWDEPVMSREELKPRKW